MLLSHQTLHTLQLLTLICHLASRAVILHNIERVTRLWSTVKTEQLNRCCRSCCGNLLTILVKHSLHTTCICSREYNIAYTQSTVLYKHRCNISTTLVECRFDNSTLCALVRICLQVEKLSLEEYLLKQFVKVKTLLCRYILTLVLTTPILNKVVHICQLLLNALNISCRLINLIDCKYHRYTRCLCVVDSLDSLRHHAVIGCNDNNSHIGNLCTTSTHSGKCLVTRGVKEGNLLTIQLNRVSTDVLSDTSSLACDNIGLTDIVEQRSLTVIDMTHNCYNRWAWEQILCIIYLVIANSLLNLYRYKLCCKAKLLGNNYKCLGIKTLVDRYHKSEVHTSRDDLHSRDIHHRCKLTYSYKLCNLKHLALHLLALYSLVHTLTNLLALLLTVFCTLILRTLSSQTSKGILNLL